MKKTSNIAAGLAAGLLSILLINTLIQGLFISLLFKSGPSYIFEGIRLSAVFPVNQQSFGTTFFIVILPLLTGILFIEISLILFARNTSGKNTIMLVVFMVINAGYLLVYIIPVIISMILNYIPNNNFVHLLKQSGIRENQQLIIVLVTSVFIFGYINFIVKRMKKSMPAVIDNKKGKANDITK
jgi:hypothetical protein